MQVDLLIPLSVSAHREVDPCQFTGSVTTQYLLIACARGCLITFESLDHSHLDVVMHFFCVAALLVPLALLSDLPNCRQKELIGVTL